MNLGKRNRTVLIIFALAMASILALTGCEPGPTASSDPASSTAASQASSSEVTLDPYVIDYYFGGTPQTDQQLVEDALNELVEPKINATVKLHCLDWGEAAEKMKVMLAAGDKLDLIFTGFINPLNLLVGNGVYQELDELLTTHGQDILEQVPEAWFQAGMYKGKKYAVPNVQYAVTNPGVLIRRDLAGKYSLDVSTVANYEALEPFLKSVKENEADVFPMCIYKTWGITEKPYFLSNGIQCISNYAGIDLDNDSFTVISLYDHPLMLQSFETARRWFTLGYSPADAATKTDVTAEQKANKYAVISAGNIMPYVESTWKTQMGTDMIGVPFSGHEGVMSTDSIAATMTSIAASSEDPERAMMFLNLLFADKEIFRTLCSGIEDVHYTKVTDDIIQVVEGSKYNPGLDWEFGNAYNGYLNYGDPIDKFEQQKAANDAGVSSPVLGFIFDVKPVQTEQAQLDAVRAEYYEGLSNGTLDPAEYYPVMLEKLKNAGLEKYLAEMQKQLTEWKTANGK